MSGVSVPECAPDKHRRKTMLGQATRKVERNSRGRIDRIKNKVTYNSRDSLVVTHPTTDLPI